MRTSVLCIAFAWLIVVLPSPAQVNSSVLNGVVLDATGSLVPQATVTVTAVATGFSRNAKTNEAGAYSISDLPPGV